MAIFIIMGDKQLFDIIFARFENKKLFKGS